MRALLTALLLAAAPAGAEEEPSGYRMSDYRAPVPATLEGATVVTTEEAHRLWTEGQTAFVDVLPHTPKPANLPEGTIWREKAHNTIPGALWLANTGYGDLAEETLAYFEDGLASATGGTRDHAVLFFCLPDCWMSWNAAKRALERGYSDVFWYPDGTDGWSAAGHDLETALPWQP